jgi:hypothetical protein
MHSSQTVFEIGFHTFPWTQVLGPLLFVAVGFLLFWVGSSSRAKWLGSRKTIYATTGAFVGSFALIIFVILLITIVPDFVAARHAYITGNSVVVEGAVQNFQAPPDAGPANESFTVAGQSFSYNVLDDTLCFHDAPLHHGPIRNGLDVRIHYHDDCIQRVDVLDQPLAQPSRF